MLFFLVKLVYEADISSLKLILNMYLQCLSINVYNNDDWFLKVQINKFGRSQINLHFFPLPPNIKTLDITS